MADERKVKDSMGEVSIPADALYGAQTQRAIDNFPVSGTPMPAAFIAAVAHIKWAAALANRDLDLLEADMAEAIAMACRDIIDGEYPDQFPVDVYQTGSGTSTNMNVNEVVAELAGRELGREVSPNDHVNLGQSSNDVIPSAIHVSAALATKENLLPALDHLHQVLTGKAEELEHVVKTGRTHLMDAMPLRMSQEVGGWIGQIVQARVWITHALESLCSLAQGGTAVGTGINTHEQFARRLAEHLSANAGMRFRPADDFFTAISSQDTAASFSGQLNTLAVTLSKIANDLRWMNSGPLAGLAEIELPALQPGSSIMPGKVNPVICESVLMAAARVMGNNTTITVAGQAGNFQLNTMLPLVGDTLLQSINLLGNSARLLADKAVTGFRVNEEGLREHLAYNPILATALNPHIGYLAAAEIAKRAYSEKRPIIDVAEEMTEFSREELEKILDPERLTHGGLVPPE